MPRLVFVNMLDRERADFFRTLDSLKDAFGPHAVATEIPIGAEHELRGIVDLIDMKAFEYSGAGKSNATEIRFRTRSPTRPQEYREKLMDEVAENSDDADGALSRGRGDLTRRDRLRAQGRRHRGHDLPGHLRGRDEEPWHRPAARRARRGPAVAREEGRGPARDAEGNDLEIEPDEAGDTVAYVFKTLADPFAGRINLFRVYSGLLNHDSHSHNVARARKSASASCSSRTARRWGTPTSSAPGDIGAVAKLKETHSGDVLAARTPAFRSRRSACRGR